MYAHFRFVYFRNPPIPFEEFDNAVSSFNIRGCHSELHLVCGYILFNIECHIHTAK